MAILLNAVILEVRMKIRISNLLAMSPTKPLIDSKIMN
jgi:hypothetical protein